MTNHQRPNNVQEDEYKKYAQDHKLDTISKTMNMLVMGKYSGSKPVSGKARNILRHLC